VLFISKYIKIIYFFIFLKLFLISAHQNNLKILKNINLKQKKNFNFFQKRFQNTIPNTQYYLISSTGWDKNTATITFLP
jgi:hypothetical protein